MRVERGKMCRATWEALKAHIMRDRKRKRDEMEADAEEARQRLKREQLKKQHTSSLQDTIAETAQLETRLQELKKEKHEMFMKLKKVLNEDETRRRQQLMKDAQAAQAAQQALGPMPSMQPVLQLQPPISQHGTGRITLNKLPGHHPSLLPMGMKRTRSPSPPPPHQPQAYRHEYLYKGQPQPPMSYGGPLSAGHPHVSVASAAIREEAHHPAYMPASRGYGMASHSVIDTSREKGDYYSSSPHRPPSHLGIRSSPLQLPVQQSQGGKSGGITSGYPVRSVGPGAYPPASGASPPVPPSSRQAPAPPSHQARYYN
ncbi:G protein pathway suppressor 2-like isoform X1 [Amphibalanus amphitrite]|uniref:G protein pathway suppressor 2-like isoform X1 n=1 Tax=Amphibalanus amphitrite TaxID=1232801 RepID=UPI001C90F518|nr:G protein pathway suppressor 2-like isoform X1 [Amphibalanus amphitrite]XP_043200428.1 G protein pathway suppressor 2-like isoform X1 [Amphibalanus amphitrite]XP_043200429.1 G protein pathway suppressor 2-like isoform X1 [Amphibalanus amphitrite]XP_043200430.1 G protein pathway suppressor 2-like isoform X1 [Amphibalanus amphitrite]XP_043200431.1 G protein pathway suppressor 2-like isoform X1 [Amphibalanus amphitrite]XP_043200432.1 G protein pathway suppressor 2-like isoform X1 [Amphibalanus